MNLSLSKDKIKILLLEGVHPRAEQTLHRHGYTNIESVSRALDPDELKKRIAGVHMVGIRSRTQLTNDILQHADRLMTIGCFCIGTNQVDLEHSALLGIPVFNAPHSNTRSVAELVVGQAIMLQRGIFPKSAAAHRGEWQKSAQGSNEVRGKTIGIIGYGHIGSQVSILAEAMGMQVQFVDIQPRLPLGNAASCEDLKQLLQVSDVVTLHVPQTPQTHMMFGDEQMKAMKPGAFLINASRGTVVDIDALVEHLKSGQIGGAAIDVFPVEPANNKERFESPLQGLDQVILTPHIGGSTAEAQENIGVEVAEKLVAYSDRGSTANAVNFPQLQLSEHEQSHRVLHIHKNVPGVLQNINKIIGDLNINILGQHLQTVPEVGYVVFDMAKQSSPDLLEALKKVPGTIRVRILY